MIQRIGAWLEKRLQGPPGRFHGVLGVFYYVDDVATVVRALRQLGHRNVGVFSPVPHAEIEHALEQGPSLVRWVTFGGAVVGVAGGFGLCIYSVYSYPLVVGGKELVSLPAFVAPGFETMVFVGALTNLLGMLALGRLPQLKARAPYDPRFSEDRIGVWVPCTGGAVGQVQELMRGHGAEEVQVHG